MAELQSNLKPKIINQVSLGGMNTFDDPKDISDQESTDILNMVFDNGFIGPRGGSFLYRSKPTGEIANPFQMLVPTTSDGIDYLIANYGVNFYLADTINDGWIHLNPSGGYTPDHSNLFYGSTSWNNGITDDKYYFCNGTDVVIKWPMALDSLLIAAASADTIITLKDAVRFPQSGKVVIKGTTGDFILSYTTKSGNVLNLAGTVGQIVPIGSSVTVPIISVPEIDQSQGVVNDSISFGTADSTGLHHKIAQSFVNSKDTIDGFIFNKQSDTGRFMGDVTFALQADSGGAPSGTDLQWIKIDNSDWLTRNLGLQGVNFRTDRAAIFTPSPGSTDLNDLVVSGNFTGTLDRDFQVIIDSVSVPASQTQTFFAGGGSSLNDGTFDTSLYSGAPGIPNEYRITMVGDFLLAMNGVFLSGTFPFPPDPVLVGETVVGTNSGAVGLVIASNSFGGNDILGLRMLTQNGFELNEPVTSSLGKTGTSAAGGNALGWHNWFQYTKNGVVINTNTGTFGPIPVSPLVESVITLTDGLTFQCSNYFGHAIGDTFILNIVSFRPDTFEWGFLDADGVFTASATNVAITGLAQALTDGISITFTNQTGHSLTDSWEFFFQYNKVTPGNTYWLVLRTSTSDTSNHPNVGINTAGGYASGGVSYDNTSDGWVGIPGIDLYFYILSTPFIPRGKILKKSQGRLFLFNSIFAENTFNYSQINDPENFSINETVDTGGFYTVFHGRGGIVDVNDFGEYLVIEKQNDLLKMQFVFNADNTAFIVQVTPIISGESIGPTSNATSLNYMNKLYYITEEEGIISFDPSTTGSQTTSALNIVSQKINNYVTQVLNFTNSRASGWNQKLFWLTAVPLIQGLDIGIVNNGVIMYDLIRNAWTRFDNWNAADMQPVNNVLYYLSLNDGAIYQCFVDYQDAISTPDPDNVGQFINTPYAYDASFSTKRIDLDEPFDVKTEVYIYMQGYISLTTKFYVDILYNENGYMGKQTYLIDGSNSNYVQNNLLGGLAAYPFGIPLLAGFNLRTMQNAVNPAFFRVYLQTTQSYKPHNIQIRAYSQDIGSQWGVNNITVLSLASQALPNQLVIGPTIDPPIVL